MNKKVKARVRKDTSKELAIDKHPNEVSQFIQQAIEQKLPVETMERLFNLQKEVKAEVAQEAFVSALAKFQSQIPVIKKTKKVLNKDGTLRYMYAPIDAVIEQIKKPLADNGLSYNWDSIREEKHIKMICKLTHIQGHSEKSTFDIPIVESEYMSSPQSYATAQSYAKRYTLLNVLGIGTADEDTDAIDADNNEVPKSQKSQIIFLLKRLGYNHLTTKKEVADAVKDLTNLELKESEYGKIIESLNQIVNEQGL